MMKNGVLHHPSPSLYRSKNEVFAPKMEATLRITDVGFAGAPGYDKRRGLLGWVAFSVYGLRLEGLTLRRTLDGHLTLSFPARRDAAGREHFYIRPVDDATRRDIEDQVFRAFGIEESPNR